MENSTQNEKRAARYTKSAIVSVFLLAMLWPLGAFVFWIMAGVISYFTFLSFYYRPKDHSTLEKPYSNFNRPSTEQQKFLAVLQKIKNVKPIHLILASGVIFFLVAIIIPNISRNRSDVVETTKLINIDSLIDQGNADYNRGQYESALANYEKVLQVDPTNQFGLYNKALVFYSKKDYRKSISLARYCAASNPDYGSAYYLLGDDYKFLNQSDSALIFFKKAYELGSRDIGLLQNLGDIYYDKQEPEDAIQFYKETIEQDSSLLYVYERLAELEPNQAPLYKQRAASLKR